MARPKPEDGRTQMLVRVPGDLVDWYREQAEARDVSVNFLVTRAMEHYREVMPPPPPPPGSADALAEATAALEAIRRG